MKKDVTAPLQLKRQRGAIPKKIHNTIAEILVDHQAFHLDATFSYGVPESLLEKVRIGSIVKVDFRNEVRTGVVVSIDNKDEKVKPITSVIGETIYPKNIVELINAVRARYVGSFHDVSRFARPVSSKFEESKFSRRTLPQPRFHLATSSQPINDLVKKLLSRDHRTLIVCDTESMLQSLVDSLMAAGISHLLLPKKSGFIFTSEIVTTNYVAVGMRGAIFAALPQLERIIVINECSPHHVEPRRPRWNTRDVALLRQRIEGCQLEFVGASMSSEIGRLLDEGAISYRSERRPILRQRPRYFFSSATYHEAIRTGLAKGSVLVSVAEKSYSNLVLCAQCNASIQCKCGGRLVALNSETLQCKLCGNQERNWRCKDCQSARFKTLRKGAGRIAEEIGKAFPRIPILIATSDHQPSIPSEISIVIATFGAELKLPSGYASLVLLDGEALSARGFLRSEENLLFRWSSLITNSPKAVAIYLSLPQKNRVVQSIISESPQRFIRDELSNRKSANLPPFSRVVLVHGEEGELSQLAMRLAKEFDSNRLNLAMNHGTLIIRVTHESAPLVLAALRALQHYRSAHGDDLLNIEVDPYSL